MMPRLRQTLAALALAGLGAVLHAEDGTEATYQASPKAEADKQIKPPEGMEQAKLRFIRLDHGGKGWDDGMGKSGADANFLRFIGEQTGLKSAKNGESHAISLLRKYPPDGYPPFVFLTGDGAMGRVSSRDLKTLREYCLRGGMLIADAGSQQFHQSFVHFMRQVFPDKPLIDIADDDMIYQLPYPFPNGSPPFWHHGGKRALGIKHEGQWVVFYHPGDMNDAWKSDGYIDMTPEMREASLKLGVNLVYYSLGQWPDPADDPADEGEK